MRSIGDGRALRVRRRRAVPTEAPVRCRAAGLTRSGRGRASAKVRHKTQRGNGVLPAELRHVNCYAQRAGLQIFLLVTGVRERSDLRVHKIAPMLDVMGGPSSVRGSLR